MGRNGCVYNPQLEEHKYFQGLIRHAWAAPPLVGSVSVDFVFAFPIPKSWSKKRQQAAPESPHVTKPDLDNLVKMTMDYMNGVVYTDDRQISAINARKCYTDGSGYTLITVT